MGDHVVGLQRILPIGLSIADGEPPELCLIVQVLHLVAGLIDHEGRMIHGLIVTYRLNAHVQIAGTYCFEASELVACRENQVAIVVIGHVIHSDHHRPTDNHGIVLTRILAHFTDKLAIGILDLIGFIVHVKRYLLETVVILYISTRSNVREDTHRSLTHRETCLKQNLTGIILLIDGKHVISTHEKIHVIIG